MTEKKQSSKFHAAFHEKPIKQTTHFKDTSPKPVTSPLLDADKFKKPAQFFKSSQSQSSHIQHSQTNPFPPNPTRRPTCGSSNGSSLAYIPSQTFKHKKPVEQTANKPSCSPNSELAMVRPKPDVPSKTLINFDANFVSTKTLQLQWERKMRLEKKAKLEAQRSQVSNDKKNLPSSDRGKSPLAKSSWADDSFTKYLENSIENHENDPLYSENLWGEELPVEQVEEVLKIASTQETQKLVNSLLEDPICDWAEQVWASPKKLAVTPSKKNTIEASLFTPPKDKSPKDNISDILDKSVSSAFVVDAGSQKVGNLSTSCSSGVINNQIGRTSNQIESNQNACIGSKFRTINSFPPPPTVKRNEPVTSNTCSTNSQSAITRKSQLLPSQRMMQQRSHSMEWLRSQLEKKESENVLLKENNLIKEGENKLLREKLKNEEEKAKKNKLEDVKERQSDREIYERKLQQTQKRLETVEVQAEFKAKEAESTLGKYRELKCVPVRSPTCQKIGQNSFSHYQTAESRPGETTAKILCEQSFALEDNDQYCESPALMLHDSKVVLESPEKPSLFPNNIASTEHIKGFADVDSFQDGRKSHLCSNKLFKSEFVKKNASFFRGADKIVHEAQPDKDLNNFCMPSMEYLPHVLFQTEFSEQMFENYLIRRPTLVELWNTSYSDAFGKTFLNNYEKANVGDTILSDPAQEILSKSRYFTTLQPIHSSILTLADETNWSQSKSAMSHQLIETATRMARELLATLGDPRILQTTYTIYDRESKILEELKKFPKNIDDFNPLSPERWGNESFVEFRRCLVIIGYLCSNQHMAARLIMNPKSINSGKTDEFYPPNSNESPKSSEKHNEDLTYTISLEECRKNNNESIQSYRSIFMKNRTNISSFTHRFWSEPTQLESSQPSSILNSAAMPLDMVIPTDTSNQKKELQDAFKQFGRIGLCSEIVVGSSTVERVLIPSFDEIKDCLQQLNMTLKVNDFDLFVNHIWSDNMNPKKIVHSSHFHDLLKIVFAKYDFKSALGTPVDTPRTYQAALQADLLKIDLNNSMSVLFAPIDRCISVLERQVIALALKHIEYLQRRLSSALRMTNDLDFTRYRTSSFKLDLSSRKRKLSSDASEVKKLKRYDLNSQPFDQYSQIQTDEVDAQNMSLVDDKVEPAFVTNDDNDQLFKFEKRQEIEQLKKKMLAEEKEFEFKQPSISKHHLAPFKIRGRNSPPACDESESDFLEIEKMFASQMKSEEFEASDWEDDMEEADCPDVDVELEFIPDLVEKFHRKLKTAELLELLSEIFKEGGALRFTHCLNGLMLGTLFMLQNIIYQRKEILPYCGKIATIIRDILYTRPQPRIILEVNILLSHAVDLPGFGKLLCHFADRDTSVVQQNEVFFKRGACLLETICYLVTHSNDSDTDVRVWAEMSQWIYQLFFVHRDYMASLYSWHCSQSSKCDCIHALDNTIVMIYYWSLSQYRSSIGILSSDIERQAVLKNIVTQGIQVLQLIHSYGSVYFISRIQSQYREYKQLLTWLHEMHSNTEAYKSFKLTLKDLLTVSELLKANNDADPAMMMSPEHNVFLDVKSCVGKWPLGEHGEESAFFSEWDVTCNS